MLRAQHPHRSRKPGMDEHGNDWPGKSMDPAHELNITRQRRERKPACTIARLSESQLREETQMNPRNTNRTLIAAALSVALTAVAADANKAPAPVAGHVP